MFILQFPAFLINLISHWDNFVEPEYGDTTHTGQLNPLFHTFADFSE